MTVEEYISNISVERREYFQLLRESILSNLPLGFTEEISYGMVGYVIPHSIYPNGYHCNPKLPLPFASIASQKNSINFYHMGIYAMPELKDWFINAYSSSYSTKLDMGKSCLRFKKIDSLPIDLIGELMGKVSCKNWINTYETLYIRRKSK